MPGISQETREARTDSDPPPECAGLASRLFEPVSIAPLVYFRIAFGAILVWSVSMFFNYKGTDLIARYFIEPAQQFMNFKYYGFGWVEPLPGRGMYVLFFALGLAGVMLAAGLLYRFAAAVFCMGFSYVFLIEQTRYMNHYYLVCLVSLLLVFIPAHRAFSLDVFFRPSIGASTVPAWTLWLLRFQFGVVYFYAGLAKCHRDWIDGTIMRMKLSRKTEFPLLGPLFAHDWVPVFFSWGGLLLDLFVVPLLLWRKTRIPTLVVTLFFHLMNSQLFNIDIFPWMMIAATVILFFPDWLPWFGKRWFGKSSASASGSVPAPADVPQLSRSWRRITLALLGTYVVIQLLVPLRHVAYADDADWTEEGQQFAWRMLMREKHALPPRFEVTYRKNGRLLRGELPLPSNDPAFWRSHWMFQKMALNPDMILQFCRYWADQLRSKGGDQIDIRAQVLVSLNGRAPQPLIDPEANLAEEPRRWLAPYPWVLPFDRDAPRATQRSSNDAR